MRQAVERVKGNFGNGLVPSFPADVGRVEVNEEMDENDLGDVQNGFLCNAQHDRSASERLLNNGRQ